MAPGANLAKHQHLLGGQTRATIISLPRQLLNKRGETDVRIDPQRFKERTAPVICRRGRGAKTQGFGARGVIGEMRSGKGFLLIQQLLNGRRLGVEKRLQWLIVQCALQFG